jgi:hypothetical protein
VGKGQEKICFARELAMTYREPVAWELRTGNTDRVLIEITNNPQKAHDWKASLNEVVPLYAAPREWVGLTKEEAKEISLANRPYVIDMIAALEARLKEKNEMP